MTRTMTDAGSAQTATSFIAAELREEILSGALQPGMRLKVDHLKARFQTAINPVREALNRMVADGLVTLEDHKGFSVAPVSLSEWRDLLEARCLIETAALRQSIANADEDWRDEIVVSLHRLLRTPRHFDAERQEPNPDWEVIHHRFHRALLARSGSETILRISDDLRMRADRYRVLAGRAQHPRTTYNAEHEVMAKAALEGDADLAARTLEEHYRVTLRVVEGYFAEMGK